jgi:hypothetical protein
LSITSSPYGKSQVDGLFRKRIEPLFAEFLFCEEPELFVAVLGLARLPPQIVSARANVFLVGQKSPGFKFMGEVQNPAGWPGI